MSNSMYTRFFKSAYWAFLQLIWPCAKRKDNSDFYWTGNRNEWRRGREGASSRPIRVPGSECIMLIRWPRDSDNRYFCHTHGFCFLTSRVLGKGAMIHAKWFTSLITHTSTQPWNSCNLDIVYRQVFLFVSFLYKSYSISCWKFYGSLPVLPIAVQCKYRFVDVCLNNLSYFSYRGFLPGLGSSEKLQL